MKVTTLVGLLLVGASQYSVAAQLNVSALCLDGWSIEGAAPAPASDSSTLILPAGSSLSRRLAASELSLRVKALPVFGQTAEEWPILELGSASLAFVRYEEEGKIALVVGDGEPELLPFSFRLDPDGRSKASVELEFSQHARFVSVIHGGKEVRFSSQAVSAPLDVAVYVGASQPWAFELLSLQIPETSTTAASAPSDGEASNTDQFNQALTKFDGEIAAVSNASAKSLSAPKADVGALNSGAASTSLLEVFTPPSVRSARTRETDKFKNLSR